MIVKKGERMFEVTELSREWKVVRTIGGVTVDIRISKEIAPDAAAAERYIAENNEFF